MTGSVSFWTVVSEFRSGPSSACPGAGHSGQRSLTWAIPNGVGPNPLVRGSGRDRDSQPANDVPHGSLTSRHRFLTHRWHAAVGPHGRWAPPLLCWGSWPSERFPPPCGCSRPSWGANGRSRWILGACEPLLPGHFDTAFCLAVPGISVGELYFQRASGPRRAHVVRDLTCETRQGVAP